MVLYFLTMKQGNAAHGKTPTESEVSSPNKWNLMSVADMLYTTCSVFCQYSTEFDLLNMCKVPCYQTMNCLSSHRAWLTAGIQEEAKEWTTCGWVCCGVQAISRRSMGGDILITTNIKCPKGMSRWSIDCLVPSAASHRALISCHPFG